MRIAEAPAHSALAAEPSDRRPVAVWLTACCALVFVMVVLGGVTRLTGSGLSMVDWRPWGILPPLAEADWRALFDQYRTTPEFHRVNFWMSLADFKGIFWLEYIHRLWGRLIGAAFLLPLVWFWLRGRIDARLGLRLAGLFLLGGAQGLLGWWMVKSGLVDRPDVSQYRLAAHLSLAVTIYLALLWLALDRWRGAARGARRGPAGHAALVLAWAFLTMVAGAFVAGIDAGLAYNTFPLMDGRLVPEGALSLSPWWVNFFDNTATVQLVHRWMALALVAIVAALWWRARREGGPAFHALAALVLVQAGLGIATLLLAVPVALAALHQAGALLVLSAALWALHGLRRAPG